MKGRVAVLEGLHRGEAHAEKDRDDQTLESAVAIPFDQRVVRPGHRRAGQQQDQRIEEGKGKRVKGVDVRRRPDAADRRAREQARGEECPEKGDEEHYLGGDEQRHAVTQSDLYNRGVVVLERRFAHNIAKPHEHDRERRDDTNDHHDPAVAVHKEDGAGKKDAGGERAEDRPRARIDEVIGMLRCCVRLAHDLRSRSVN